MHLILMALDDDIDLYGLLFFISPFPTMDNAIAVLRIKETWKVFTKFRLLM